MKRITPLVKGFDVAISKNIGVLGLIVLISAISGCWFLETNYSVFQGPYEQTIVSQTSSGEVVAMLDECQDELVSQSPAVIASWGQKEDDKVGWLNMFAFDDESSLASRKYFFFRSEITGVFKRPERVLKFNAEIQFDPDFLESPFANANARTVAILKKTHEFFINDIGEITSDNKQLQSAKMMVNSTFNQLFYELDATPALAKRLADFAGLEFDLKNFGQANARLLIQGNIVLLEIRDSELK